MSAPSTSSRLRPGWSVVLVALLVLVSGTPALAQSTPAAGATRLYVGHEARLTARMPATWEPDRSLRADYRGEDGFIASASLWVDNASVDSVEAQCGIAAGGSDFDHAGQVELTTWRGRDACRITVPGGVDASPVGIVVAHPRPGIDGDDRYVLVMADAGHVDAILDSVSFDPALVTPDAYLDAALDIIETSWLWRDEIDWEQVRADAHATAGDLAATGDLSAAHRAIEQVVATLAMTGPDDYAVFLPPAMATGSGPAMAQDVPSGRELPGGIGYLALPGLYADGQDQRYADEMHAAIDAQRDAAACGWVLDLRANGGGNLYAMLGALTPLLESGPLLGIRDASGETLEVELSADGVIVYDGQPLTWLASWSAPLDPELATRPVAILVDGMTASAAEHITIAMRARPGTRVFGQPTYGLVSSPRFVSLFDEAAVLLDSAWVTGPLGATYPDGLVPDKIVPAGPAAPDPLDDETVRAATAWLQAQPGCAPPAATPAT